MARSKARIDASQVEAFAQQLLSASLLVERMGSSWQEEHGERWAEQMRATVPVGPGVPVHLRDQIRQVTPGGITMGDAYWWRFLEHGTVNMGPQPFVNPAMKKIRTPARKDASQRALDLLRGVTSRAVR